MPTISRFYGIIIRMFFDEHAPPHFHAVYGEFTAEVAIATLEVLAGGLPRRALVLVLEWTALHRSELLEDWELCRQHHQPKQIQPLD
jgi:hypothetical protein